MTFDSDGEMAAIKAIRIALTETDDYVPKREIVAVIADMWERHEMAGVSALVLALARHSAGALIPLAEVRGVTPDDLLNSYEMRKLAQIVDPPE